MQVLQKINKYISQILKVALIACFNLHDSSAVTAGIGRYLFHKGFFVDRRNCTLHHDMGRLSRCGLYRT